LIAKGKKTMVEEATKGMTEMALEDWEMRPIMEKFHELEKQVLGFENFINCDDDHYLATLEKLRLVVRDI
jgi:hypothetical protein